MIENKFTNKKHLITIILLLFAITFIIIGIFKNENTEVMKKASKICLECIGIG